MFVQKENTSLLLAVLLTCTVVTLLPLRSHASASVSTDGCFEREATDIASTLWLSKPTCTVTVTNTETTADVHLFTVINMDQNRYMAEYADGTPIFATHQDNLFFPANLQPNSTTTITIRPWDYSPTDTDFWFAALSDTQSEAGGVIPNPIYLSIMEQLDVISPPFIVHAGDIIKGSSTNLATHNDELATYDTEMLTHPVSFFPVPGTHEAKQDLDTTYDLYYGEQHTSFAYGNVRYIGIFSGATESDSVIPDEELTWLQTELSSATETYKMVYMHHPLIQPEWAGTTGIAADQKLELAQILADNEVDILLTGHAHGYDDQVVDGTVVPGLSGSFRQLVIGGAGGTIKGYEGDNFFMLFHVQEDGIEFTRMDIGTVDITQSISAANDGSASELTFNTFNDGTVDLPWYRVQYNIDAGPNVYATLSDGSFIEVQNQEVDNAQRGVIDMPLLAAGTNEGVTVKERRDMYTNWTNTYTTDGTLTFSSFPTPEAQTLTTLLVADAEQNGTVTVSDWDTESDTFTWTETTGATAWTRFSAINLRPDREYRVLVDGTMVNRVYTDSEGALSFRYQGKKAVRNYQLELEQRVVPRNLGVLPAVSGGSNFQLIGDAGDVKATFFTHGQELSSGFESIWANVDGDRTMELVVVPVEGTIGHVRVFERDGALLGQFFPFGENYTGGVSLAAGDLNANGKQELVVSRRDGISTVSIYSFRAKKGNFKKIGSFQAFPDTYTKGVNTSTADIDADGDAEIVVAPLEEQSQLLVYRWQRKKQKAKQWLTATPFGGEQAAHGLTVAVGDVNSNGQDNLVVGSYSGGGVVRVLEYRNKSLQKIHGKRVFPRDFTGGVTIYTGNVNNNAKDEIFVTSRTQNAYAGRVAAFTARKKTVALKSIKGFAPLGIEGQEPLHLTLADLNSDWKMEVISAKKLEGNVVNVHTRIGKAFQETDSYAIYTDGFNGGLSLTQ